MKLKLETFTEITILKVFDPIPGTKIDILLAGLNKLKELKSRWLIIDLTHASPDENTLRKLIAIRPMLESMLKGLILVGPSVDLCQHQDFRDALMECQKGGSQEARFLMEKWDLEQTVAELEQKKRLGQEGDYASMSEEDRKTEIARLRRETYRLKKLQSFYIDNMVARAFYAEGPKEYSEATIQLKERCIEFFQDLQLLKKGSSA